MAQRYSGVAVLPLIICSIVIKYDFFNYNLNFEMKKMALIFTLFMVPGLVNSYAQPGTTELMNAINRINSSFEELSHRFDILEKKTDDVLWYNKVGDIAFIDKVFITGPPLAKEKNPTGQGAGNPVKFWTYIFIPKDADPGKKYPLLVLPHGGVHANFTTYYTHIIREMVSQGYIVTTPEYRGSTGYGAGMYNIIDYGGLEIQDVDASRQYMVDNYSIVDKNRVGIVGWSHGGYIALFDIFEYPQNYKVAFTGVPVSDLIARMGYKDQEYRDIFSGQEAIGKPADENVAEYRKRSPAWQTSKYQNTPLLIHTNTIDEDVNVLEVEHLIKSLKAEGKNNFSYEIFENMPGGHSFDRMDYMEAKEIRMKIYNHLNKYLNPPKPFKSVKDLQKAGYGFN
ncbi:MAG: prolyl oligopeptidase family serine peptidase [Bacteroidales bacterium]|jgi:dipeptidyl aminopeptidase/acylaminoacyl peptidase|nr:prolyl oligopeptidase family serine peptidase [Bacteroidales bacterium]